MKKAVPLELRSVDRDVVQGIAWKALWAVNVACTEWLAKRGLTYETMAQLNFAQRRAKAQMAKKIQQARQGEWRRKRTTGNKGGRP